MTRQAGPKRILLPSLVLGEVCNEDDDGAIERIVILPSEEFRYFFRPSSALPLAERDTRTSSFNHFAAVIDESGAPWGEAVAYLAHIVDSAGMPATGIDNARPIASDLADFARFSKDNNFDFREFPAFEQARPTYRYRTHLDGLVRRGLVKASVARRRLLSMIGMYDWLIKNKLLAPAYPPWEESEIKVGVESRGGSRVYVKRRVTDLRIRFVRSTSPYTDHIADGGDLRPLPVSEQKVLLEVLAESDNIEARLLHVLMLVTCARTQTALTLRMRHFVNPVDPNLDEVRIPAGPGTGIDTKGSKSKVSLFVPGWLYQRICIYANSPRAKARRARAKVSLDDSYLFLTNRGSPYYESVKDRSIFDPNKESGSAQQGQPLRQFIHDWMMPRMRQRLGANYRYRAQDLRATGGLNMTAVQLELVKANMKTLAQARDFVRNRMWHEHGETTDRYLGFQHLREHFFGIQRTYEEHMETLMRRAANGTPHDD
jgi:hypothetical protein